MAAIIEGSKSSKAEMDTEGWTTVEVELTGPKRRTAGYVTKFECVSLIKARIGDINRNFDRPYIEVPPGVTDVYQIAHNELKAGKSPYLVKRRVSEIVDPVKKIVTVYYEYCYPNEVPKMI